MKFTFDKDAMIKEIAIAQEIISNKNVSSILSNVLLTTSNNTLYIKATDIKVNFETQIPVQVEEDGSTTIYCDKFMGILTSLPSGEIEFNQQVSGDEQSTNAIIKPVDKRIKFEIKSISQEKFPEFTSAEDVPYFEVPSKEFKSMINETSFAVSEDETRYFLNGVYFEKKDEYINLVGTDGRRLSFASKPLLNNVQIDFPAVIVHPKILNIVQKHAPEEGNISIAVIDKMIFFRFGNYKFGAVLIDGQFPNYERVIPEHQEHSFQVNKSDFSSALKRVSQMIDKKAGRIYLNINSGVLKITSPQSDLGSADEEIPCEYDGQSYTIALNYRYIDEPLKTIDTERITFEFTEEMKALTMRPEPAAEFFHIIMPMQKE